jgi:hypothetical protein
MSSALDILATLKVPKPSVASTSSTGFTIGMDDFTNIRKASAQPPEPVLRAYQETERGDFRIERESKATLERMFKEAMMEQEFTFYTELGKGKIYVNNMRVYLSRVKVHMRAQNKKLKQFKLLIVGYQRMPKDGVDKVVVMRHDPLKPRNLQQTAELEKLMEFGT